MTILSEHTSQAQWHAACCGLHCICLCFAPHTTGWITNKTWNFGFAMKPLRDLQLNSLLLRLIISITGVRLAEHLPIILLGRILLLSPARCKWPSPPDPIVLCWVWDTNPNFPAASYTYNDLRVNPHTATFDEVQVWIPNGATLPSWIFYLLDAMGWKESGASGKAHKADLI